MSDTVSLIDGLAAGIREGDKGAERVLRKIVVRYAEVAPPDELIRLAELLKDFRTEEIRRWIESQ